MSNVRPPLLGFNNNVRHRGRIFHIQTEDSGVKSPRVVTHLFADGGRIIKTTRTEYAEHVERPDMQAFVRSLMKEQHKNMFTALRLGELDVMLENACGKFEQALPPCKSAPVAVSAPSPAPRDEPIDGVMPQATVRASAPDFETPPLASAFGDADRRSERANALSNPNPHRVVTPAPLATPGSQPPPLPARPLAKSNPPPRKLRPSPAAPGVAPASLSRPASRFAGPSKSPSSLFGDGVISEQSLDEVILSYLAEDLDGSPE